MLDEILTDKRMEVEKRKAEIGVEAILAKAMRTPPPRDFRGAVSRPGHLNLIAEIKYRSPSAGAIREGPPPAEIAKIYERGGASAISVLTDERHFGGKLEFLDEARGAAGLPLLRKDFVVDEFQIYEARAAGADAVLLIVAALDDDKLRCLLESAGDVDLAALVEVHSGEELKRALGVGVKLVGINNRNLQTLEVNVETTFELIGDVPEGVIVVSESGVSDRAVMERLKDAGVSAALVGEALMRASDIEAEAQELIQGL